MQTNKTEKLNNLCLYSPISSNFELEAKNAGLELITWEATERNPHIRENIHFAITNCLHPKEWQLNLLPNLRCISNNGTGLNHLDVPSLTKKNILVCNTPGIVAPATAEIAFGLMIAVGRKFKASQQIFQLGKFNADVTQSTEVTGSTLGIVGLGAIGSEIAKRAQAFDMTIFYHQRNRNKDKETQYNATYCAQLTELLPLCDFIVICCPYTDQTHQMIDYDQLRAMKSGSFLINVGRGGLVNTEALVKILESGHLAGAGLDVTEPEPLPPNHPLLNMVNVFVTPHIGTDTKRTMKKLFGLTISNIVDVMNNRHCPNVVNYA